MADIKLSFHVDNIPCVEEYYMGARIENEAFIISIPENLIPKKLLDTIKGNRASSRVTNIAIIQDNT